MVQLSKYFPKPFRYQWANQNMFKLDIFWSTIMPNRWIQTVKVQKNPFVCKSMLLVMTLKVLQRPLATTTITNYWSHFCWQLKKPILKIKTSVTQVGHIARNVNNSHWLLKHFIEDFTQSIGLGFCFLRKNIVWGKFQAIKLKEFIFRFVATF